MKRIFPFLLIFFLFGSLIIIAEGQSAAAHAQDAPSPTATYDPLAEPVLPENPSEYELGQNWYWHHCMPCHGDKGQGLTDEFRAIWPEDHQNCWGRGCHGGHGIEDDFPIPTVVPPIVSSAKLARFSSQQALFDFLKATHPPQYPGYLSDEQYHAIALFIFSMNNRTDADNPTAAPTLTPTPQPEQANMENSRSPVILIIILGLGILLIITVVVWGTRKRIT